MFQKAIISALLCPMLIFSQNSSSEKDQGLLWKISGNGLKNPSYLYGTMHVSNKVAFHLSESFFNALNSAEVIALEGNPEFWMKELATSTLIHDMNAFNYGYQQPNADLYSSFIPYEPSQSDLAYYLSHDEDMLNSFLWRTSQVEQDFEEQTYLDLYIFQAGKKTGKKIIALEDFNESMKSVLYSGKYDKDAVRISDRQAKAVLGDYNHWGEFQEDAYRKGDLAKLDTITSILNPGKYYRKYMLDVRNRIMADGIDSIAKHHSVFTGIGAAHLPGKNGVINMLRDMGYTVTSMERDITSKSIEMKEDIDDLIYSYEPEQFVSDDGLIKTTYPQLPIKTNNSPYQEYIFADMANSAFYSIKRISTSSAIYGKSIETYMNKIDSLLFENIPGKILSKDTILLSGFKTLDITNKTKLGDLQRYNIVFTPLEIIICKVGGKKEFLNSEQPKAFFDNLELLHGNFNEGVFTPNFGAFQVWLPKGYRSLNYPSTMDAPGNTFMVNAVGEDGAYYSVRHRQYHDFKYIEEDDFELEYIIEKIEDDEKLTVDTAYIVEGSLNRELKFELTNKSDNKMMGEAHIVGPNYFVLLTSASGSNQLKFFDSFKPQPFKYKEEFTVHSDTTFHVEMVSPVRINNHDKFFFDIIERNGKDNEDLKFEGEDFEKTITTTYGEKLKLEFSTLHKYESWATAKEFWTMVKKTYGESLISYKDTLLNSTTDTTYFSETRELWFTDTNSTRAIRAKVILENQAIYSLVATVDTLGYSSPFIDEAFKSFKSSGDTIIGTSVLQSKNDMFFEHLESGDSTLIFEASSSIWDVEFEDEDLPRMKDIFKNYFNKNFDRSSRLNLLYQMVNLDNPASPEYFKNLYYENLDSSSYQFAILKSLARMETREGNAMFTKLILDEPPFDKDSWTHSNLFWELRDSLELASDIYPDILELADFEEYKPYIFDLLADLVNEDLIKTKQFKKRYGTFLRFGKVELKKQKSADMEDAKNSRTNSDLVEYATILTPFSKKSDVQELYKDMLKVKSKVVLSDLLEVLDGHTEIPDSIWNVAASERKELKNIYNYLQEAGKLDRLEPKYRTQEAIAEGLARIASYDEFDTISLITTKPVEMKGPSGMAYFFRVKYEDDDLWRLIYVVFDETEDNKIITEKRLVKRGEQFNPQYDDLDEIIDDAVKEIFITDRRRVVKDNGYGYYDY